MHPRRTTALVLAVFTFLFLFPSAFAQSPLEVFDRSLHAGEITGSGGLAAINMFEVRDSTATLTFAAAVYEKAWQNATTVEGGPISIPGLPEYAEENLGPGTIRMATNMEGARISVLQEKPGSSHWTLADVGGSLDALPPGTTEAKDEMPIAKKGNMVTAPVKGTSVWQTSPAGTTTVQGDFWIAVYGWDLQFGDGRFFRTGTMTNEIIAPVHQKELTVGWLLVKDATLTLQVSDGATKEAYVHDPVITTVGTTRLQDLPLDTERVYKGTTTLEVTSRGDRLSASVTHADDYGEPAPAATFLSRPTNETWLWGGGAGAFLVVALFVTLVLISRNVTTLEWRSYHALDEHRPVQASLWASLWTRRDPWDGHAWSARGEARLLMDHDRGAARDFKKAHALLPPEERAINALHAARAHARTGHATRTAHWLGIVASLDLNVLLTAREEPDFAEVWDMPPVQRAIQQLLGVDA